jgi:hypothetical protein
METTIITLPIEVQALAVKVSSAKQSEVQTVLLQIFTGTEDWAHQVEEIVINGTDDKMSIGLAEAARKNVKQARLNAEKVFDAKRNEVQLMKSEFDLEDKLWLKAKQIMQIKFKAIEDAAEWKANFVKRHEAEQKELRTRARINDVSEYAAINSVGFEHMSDDSFVSFLNGLKATHEARLKAEQKEKEDRIAKEKAEKEAIEKQAIENARLKAEAEQREKEIEAERKEHERELAIEKARLKAEAEQREKIEIELQKKKEAEEKVEAERIEAELQEKKEAEKKAKAPIKERLTVWIDGFNIAAINIENEKKELIVSKFEAFKEWAKKEVENL